MITVFYDGKCGLCRREIHHYKKVAPTGIFDWQDITLSQDRFQSIGVSYVDGLRELHAQDKDGTLHVGVDAFLIIWQQMPRWRLLGKIVGNPLLKPVVRKVYAWFAAWRFNRLGHCQVALNLEKQNLSG